MSTRARSWPIMGVDGNGPVAMAPLGMSWGPVWGSPDLAASQSGDPRVFPLPEHDVAAHALAAPNPSVAVPPPVRRESDA